MTSTESVLSWEKDRAAWAEGARTVRQAMRETGLTRDELWELMRRGVVRYCVKDGRRTRLLSWGDLVKHLAGLAAQPK